MSFDAVERELEAAAARHVFPGAVLLVRDGERVHLCAAGARSVEPTVTPMRPETIFDLASLTKPLATTIAVMLLVREGKIRLDDRVSRFFHNFGVHGKTHVTFRHLLNHSSGLPAWQPYYKEIIHTERKGGRINFVASPSAKSFVYQAIHRERLETPPATHARYSDLGFMLLGEAVEEIGGMALDRFCQQRIYRPLGLRTTAFVDLWRLRARKLEPIPDLVAPTERCPWRKKILCGEVHDDNAYAMGGVAGHSGLFASAADLDVLLCRLRACYTGADGWIPQSIMREFWTRDRVVESSTWALGWDTPSPHDSSAGTLFNRRAVGHLGFTGTSVWLDLDRPLHIILLSNRVHPNRDNEAIREFRPLIHDAVMRALE